MRLKATQVANIRKALAAKQGNVCAVCGKPFTTRDGPVLDHCHKTGYVRGVLHRSCNGQEGRVLTKAQRCHSGVSGEDYIVGLGKYYETHSTPQTPYLHPTWKTEEEKRLDRNKKARQRRAALKAAKMLEQST